MTETTPNPPPYEIFVPKYLTYVPGRDAWRKYPGFKQHRMLNHAKNAINNALSQYGWRKTSPHRMKIWEFNFSTNEWDLLYDIAPGTPISELPWRKNA